MNVVRDLVRPFSWTQKCAPSPLRQPIKWLHLESLDSFAQRLLFANHLEPDTVRLAIAPGLHEHRFHWADHVAVIEVLAGRRPGDYLRLTTIAQPVSEVRYPARYLCRLCAAGESVAQIPHDRGNWCLRHPGQMVWVGPGTTPKTQPVLPREEAQVKAERTFQRMVADGRIDAQLHARAWEMVRDNAWLTRPDGWKPALAATPDDHEVRGRAALYPETVAVLETLSDPVDIERWRARHPDELRDDIAGSLPAMHGPVDVLVERIVLWLRPLRREIRPTRIDPLNVPLDAVDASAIIDTSAPYPSWIKHHPRAVAEWDWSRNDPARDPWDAPRISATAWWVCDKGHSWETKPLTRGAAESSCPYCVSQAVWSGHTDLGTIYPDIAAEWDHAPGANPGDPDQVSARSGRKVNWRCRDGHRWVASINNRTRLGAGCPFCAGCRAIRGETDLATLRPDLAAEWDVECNGLLSPSMVSPGSGKRVWWKGSCGHSWRAAVCQRTRENGSGCPYCANQAVLLGFNDLATTHPRLAREWGSGNSRTTQEVTAGSTCRASWKCDRGHEWRATIVDRAAGGTGCPVCASRAVLVGFNDLATVNPSLTTEWDTAPGANDRTPFEVRHKSNYVAGWKCGRGHTWRATVAKRTLGRGCPFCSGRRIIPGETNLAGFLAR